MTAHNPLAARTRRPFDDISGKWTTDNLALDPAMERLERYAVEMTSRDPRGYRWAVVGERPNRYVECLGDRTPSA
jgi:hypothetical protein